MTPTWYDILGLSPGASTAEIKAAWRDATDKFEPGTGGSQFRMFNEAADVLLDPDRRRAYDAELGLAPAEPAAPPVPPDDVPVTAPESDVEPVTVPESDVEPVTVPESDVEPETVPESEAVPGTEVEEPARSRAVPGWAALTSTFGLAILGVLTVTALVLAVVLGVNLHSRVSEARDNPNAYAPSIGTEASSVAERATAAILSYDYRTMQASRTEALKFLTPAYQKTYEKNFDGLLNGAAGFPPVVSTQTVVAANVLGTAVVDATPGKVRVLVFVNQNTSRAGKAAKIIDNRVVVTMVRRGGKWLIDGLDALVATF